MKKYLSVIYPAARESFYKILLVWALGAVVQSVSVVISMNKNSNLDSNFLPDAVRYSVWAIFFVTCFLLCKSCVGFSSETSHTLCRLRVSEKAVFAMQSLYNCVVFVLGILSEIILMFLLLLMSQKYIDSEFVSVQRIYLMFYRNGFLFSLFCGFNFVCIVRNVFLVISCAVNCAAFSFLLRRKHKWFPIAVCTGLALIAPGYDSYEANIVFIVIFFLLTLGAVVGVKVGGETHEA